MKNIFLSPWSLNWKESQSGTFKTEEWKEVVVKHEIRFLDSLKFTLSGLEGLVKNLSREDLEETTRFFGEKNRFGFAKRSLSLWIHGWFWKIQKAKSAEEKLRFSPDWSRKKISDEDFDHAQRVWKEFELKKHGRFSRSLFENWCFASCRCYGKFQKTLRKTLRVGSRALFHHPRNGMGCNAEDNGNWVWNFWKTVKLKCCWWLKKESGEEFQMHSKDTPKPTINSWKIFDPELKKFFHRLFGRK